MSFSAVADALFDTDCSRYTDSVAPRKIEGILSQSVISEYDFLTLLSDTADRYLEPMARKASLLTRQHFGNVITLFTPMYVSNYCENVCPYCSFARHHAIVRSHLTLPEIEKEARRISGTGMRHILLLTGEAPTRVSIDYLVEVITLLRTWFSSIAIEIYPLSEPEYARLIDAGCDQLTIYQETYHRGRYEQLHRTGPKADFSFRLATPDRACKAGIRAVTVGALYGLYDWRYDAFSAALHAAYLQRTYPSVEVAISFPRLRPQAGAFRAEHYITDREFVRMLTAFRIFLPAAGITLSTRESAAFRMSVLPLGVTRMSAGVSTSVGGHSGTPSTPQFEIADTRDLPAICSDLLASGFQPVMHDWHYSLMR